MAELAIAVLEAMRRGSVRATDEQLPARTLAVTGVGTHGVVFAGADSDGLYTLAIAAATDRPTPAPIRMAALSVEFGARYILDHQGVHDDIRVTLLRCNSIDPEIRELFASFAEMLLASLPDEPRESDVAAELDNWVGLFWRLQAPPRTDVVGLVGELCLLRVAPSADEWVRAWHGDPGSTVDFVVADPAVEVEVKATQSASRTHTLSAGQAFSDGNRYFASVHVDLRDSGDTIGNFVRGLADDIESPGARQRFWTILSGECGSGFAPMMAERFVWQQSLNSIRFFKREDVPRPELVYPLPVGIAGLRFTSDFSDAPCLAADVFFTSIDDGVGL